MSDDFPANAKSRIGARAGWICSNPKCLQSTSGPSDTVKQVTSVGEAAHICGARPGSARYDATMTPEQRRSPENGIWLCSRCAKFIDDDEITYPVSRLQAWKTNAEARARNAIEGSLRPQLPNGGESASLSKEAETLLLNAAEDKQGQLFICDMLHGFVVQTNNRDFVEDKLDHRDVARWRGVVRQLERFNLIEQSGPSGLFILTDLGYQAAERLRL